MQGDPRFFTGKATPSRVYQMGGYTPNTGNYYAYGVPTAPSFDATLATGGRRGYPGPLNGVELQPSEICPKNFIIFDQAENKSRVMFHPALAQNFSYRNFDISATHAQQNCINKGKNVDYQDKSSSIKEDSDDIDALLSFEDEEEEEEDDVVSTGRTPDNYGNNSPDSLCSSDGSKSLKLRFPSQSSTSSGALGSAFSERKKERMRKMVKALRGIIPGADQMDTPTVLDEAVRYLKSLKVELKELGIQRFDN